MFERRIVPVYLVLCAVALAIWTASAPDSAPASTLGWALAWMAALYAVANLMDRPPRSPGSACVLEEATRVNAARGAPRPEDPRR